MGTRENDKEIMKYYNGFMAVILILIPIVFFSAPILIKLFIHKSTYYQATAFIPIIALGFVPRVHTYMFTVPMYYFNKTNLLPKAYLFAALIQLAMTFVLVRYFSLWGAAWSSFLSKIILAFFLYFQCKKVIAFKLNIRKQLLLPVVYILTIIILDQFVTPDNNVIIYGMGMILGLLFVLIAFRNEIRALSSTIFKTSDI